jgi:hypothetical protein
MTMKFIASTTITGSPADISITNIPQTFTDLYIVISSIARTSANPNALVVNANGYTSTNGSWRDLRGNGSTISTATTTTAVVGLLTNISNTFNLVNIYIPNYSSSGTKIYHSDCVTENNGTTAYININAGRFDVASAITSLQFGDGSAGGGLGVGSSISIYGIIKGSGGATPS